VSWISDHILVLSGLPALAVIFALPALEASVFLGFVIPGEIAVVAGGVLAFTGKVPLWGALVAACLGAWIGDSVGYEVGKHWGDALIAKLPSRLIKPDHVLQGKRLINRHGGKAVFFGRYIAALRALVPGLAGMSGMTYRHFVFWNVLGGTVWATGFTLLGYLAGTAWEQVEGTANVVSYIVFGVVVVLIIGAVLFRRHRARRRAHTDQPAERDPDESEPERAPRLR
jgi:membrane protein DedA with SNARE-associated domain